MAKVLNALSAEITTATVSVKSLTIERRQVTLAVFRQLIEEPIFDWQKLALRGVGWGHVRYLIDAPPSRAINLVWQRGTELRRCIVRREAPEKQPVAEETVGYSMFIIGRAPIGIYPTYRGRHFRWRDEVYPADMGKLNVEEACGRKPAEISEAWHEDVRLWQERCVAVVRDYRRRSDAEATAAGRMIEERRAEYAAIVGPLFDLPQLFIAV